MVLPPSLPPSLRTHQPDRCCQTYRWLRDSIEIKAPCCHPRHSVVFWGRKKHGLKRAREKEVIRSGSLPEVQEAPEGQCCPACTCRSGGGKGTWPRLSARKVEEDKQIRKKKKWRQIAAVRFTPTRTVIETMSWQSAKVHGDVISFFFFFPPTPRFSDSVLAECL